MKKVISLLFVSLICITLILPCYAAEFENPPIVDTAEILSESQLEELTEKVDAVRQKYNFEVAIVTETEMSGYDAMATADDIYDYEGYGAGENDDGILLYISESPREYWITTHAYGLTVFNDNGIAYMKKQILPHLEDNNYYLAMEAFIETADELLEMAENGEPFNKKQYDTKTLLIIIGCLILVPLIIAWFMMNGKLAKMKTAVENDYAANYVKPGSKRLDVSRDIFLYSRVTKTEKPKNNSGSHRSSSGRTHGGGGGSY